MNEDINVQLEKVINAFIKRLISNSKDLPPNYVAAINDNFWDLF